MTKGLYIFISYFFTLYVNILFIPFLKLNFGCYNYCYYLLLLVITNGKLSILKKLSSNDAKVTADLYILSFIGIILTIVIGYYYKKLSFIDSSTISDIF